MEANTINIIAFIIVLIAIMSVLVWIFRRVADFLDTLKFASKGRNRQGQPYITEQRMEAYYKSKANITAEPATPATVSK